jgi:prepilin-type N-terminal cleavage/methylation domain-containing protein
MKHGFTLLEVLVAAVVLSIGLLGGIEVIARCAAASQGMEARERGLVFARTKLEEVLKEPTLTESTQSGEGMDGEQDPEFRWQISVTSAGAALPGTPAEGAASSLVVVAIVVTHQGTGITTELSTMRRADLNPPEATAESTTGTTGGAAAGGGQ